MDCISQTVQLAYFETITHSSEETQGIGRAMGSLTRPGHVFLLDGELGSGKTCLTQGVLWGMGGDEYARSPTFVLVSEYKAAMMLYHIDLYRLGTPEEILDLGLDEYLNGEGVCVVEWADRAPGLLSDKSLTVSLETVGDTDRRLIMSTDAPEYTDIIDAVADRALVQR